MTYKYEMSKGKLKEERRARKAEKAQLTQQISMLNQQMQQVMLSNLGGKQSSMPVNPFAMFASMQMPTAQPIAVKADSDSDVSVDVPDRLKNTFKKSKNG